MQLYSTETVMAMHRAKVDEMRRYRTVLSRSRRVSQRVVRKAPLRPAVAR